MSYEYKYMPSPVGQLTLVARDGKLTAILWEKERPNRVRLGALQEASNSPVLLETERQLKEYFAGARNRFELELDFAGVVVEIRPAQTPQEDQSHRRVERAGAACPTGQGL